MAKKKWHDRPNLMNRAGPHTAPGMVKRSAADHSHDQKPARTHTRGWPHEASQARLHRGDLQEGHTHKHLGMGYRKEKLL